MKNTSKKSNKKWIIILAIVAILVVGGYSFNAYVNDYYPASNQAKTALKGSSLVQVEYIEKDVIAFVPQNDIKAGMIFYPGGKVEYTAYAPLLSSFAENGVLCILPEMPFNLAIFDSSAADSLKDYYPDVKSWYMAGHSLGGAIAAKYTAKHTDQYQGLILLASYSTEDLSQSGLNVISIYGSEDKVLNMDNYNKNKANLPEDMHEIIIDGGCHALFGSYGNQSGDGTPTITNNEQIQTTVDNVMLFICP